MEKKLQIIDVYCFHPQTGEFTGITQAQEDPMQPGSFLLPADTTTSAPPEAQEGKKRVYLNGQWSLQDIVVEPPPQLTEQEKAALARAQRNNLLAMSDWTQLGDVPTWVTNNLAAWQTYRQELRDVPQQPEFPNQITWPQKPQ